MKNTIKIITNQEGLYPGDLKHYFRHIWNAPNIDLPYHNLRHMLHVMWSAYNGCKYYYYMRGVRLRNVLIAALFHDYDHSGLTGDDSVNISRAIEGIKKHIAPEDKEQLVEIIDLISATQFPHLPIEGGDVLAKEILRDADISYTLAEVWISTVNSLGHELRLTPTQMLMGQVPFLQTNLKLETDWAKKEYSQKIQDRIEEVNLMVETLMS